MGGRAVISRGVRGRMPMLDAEVSDVNDRRATPSVRMEECILNVK
jgi:hypothetical protein